MLAMANQVLSRGPGTSESTGMMSSQPLLLYGTCARARSLLDVCILGPHFSERELRAQRSKWFK